MAALVIVAAVLVAMAVRSWRRTGARIDERLADLPPSLLRDALSDTEADRLWGMAGGERS